jgi:hypothetical protein
MGTCFVLAILTLIWNGLEQAYAPYLLTSEDNVSESENPPTSEFSHLVHRQNEASQKCVSGLLKTPLNECSILYVPYHPRLDGIIVLCLRQLVPISLIK